MKNREKMRKAGAFSVQDKGTDARRKRKNFFSTQEFPFMIWKNRNADKVWHAYLISGRRRGLE